MSTKAHKFLAIAAVLFATGTAQAQLHMETGIGAAASNAGTVAASIGASYSWPFVQVQAYGMHQWKNVNSATVMAGAMFYEHYPSEVRWWVMAGATTTWYTQRALHSGGNAKDGTTFTAGFRVDYGKVAMQVDYSGKTLAGRFVFKFFNHNR